MILIDDITFSHEKFYSDGGSVEVAYGDVEIDYKVINDGNEIPGSLTINFSEYEDMKFNNIVDKVKEHFNKTVEEI